MARDAVINILGEDNDVLIPQYGIDKSKVFSNYGLDGSPKTGHFLVLRWEEVTADVRDVKVLTVWAHRATQLGPNYVALQRILERVRFLLENAVHVEGADGEVLTAARYTGMGRDLHDTGYDTFTKNAAFQIVSRMAA